MAEYTKKTTANGAVQYRNITENKIVSKDSLTEDLLARLEVAPEGTPVPESADISTENNEVAKSVAPNPSTRKVNLQHPILINGKVYEARKDIEVQSDIADDLERMDEENSQYERDLLRSQNRAREASQVRPVDVK